jgi:hypothetical protein
MDPTTVSLPVRTSYLCSSRWKPSFGLATATTSLSRSLYPIGCVERDFGVFQSSLPVLRSAAPRCALSPYSEISTLSLVTKVVRSWNWNSASSPVSGTGLAALPLSEKVCTNRASSSSCSSTVSGRSPSTRCTSMSTFGNLCTSLSCPVPITVS